jgi:hypothetical protein
VVDTLSSEEVKGPYFVYERAQVKIVASLKGGSRWDSGTTLTAEPFRGELINAPLESAEHLRPGKRYIVFPSYSEDKEPVIDMERCGVLEDTPQVMHELERGFAQNDALRGPELR